MLTRRVFLQSGGLAFLSLGAGPRFLDRLALATPQIGSRKTLVSIFLRGAMDGLMAVPPIEHQEMMEQLRPRLAMSAARSSSDSLLDLDGRYALHPALEPMLPFWNDSRLAIVHAVGSPNATRSHFDAQDFMETGTPNRKGTPTGWLNRVVAHSAPSASPLRAVSITGDLPRSLYGSEPAVAISSLDSLRLSLPGDEYHSQISEGLEVLYQEYHRSHLERRGSDVFDTLRLLSLGEFLEYRSGPGRYYPASPLGRSLMQIAYLIKAGVGLEVACAESQGWDTHVSQGKGIGSFARNAQDLASSIAAFWRDIEAFQDDIVVLTMTEFGRTVRENGSAGTDHGHGSCMFVLGNAVDGGKVYGDLPGLEPELLYEGRDLPVTTDFRAVFSEVSGKLFDITDDQAIFPGWAGTRLPVLW